MQKNRLSGGAKKSNHLKKRCVLKETNMIKMNDDVIIMNMRTIVEIPGDQIDKLSEVCRQDKISRAEAIRRAIEIFLRNRETPLGKEVFGIWRDREMDGLEYQVKLRSEW